MKDKRDGCDELPTIIDSPLALLPIGRRRKNLFANYDTVNAGDFLVGIDGELIPISKVERDKLFIIEDGCIVSEFSYADVTIRKKTGKTIYGENQNCPKRRDCSQPENCPPCYRRNCELYNMGWDRA